MVEMTIDSIRVSLMNYQRVVILREKGTNRYLPIWIGPAEADAIAVKLQNVELSRPLTHDLLQSVISTLGASVEYVVVSGLKEDTFYARLALNVDGVEVDIDSRPSDALALAVRVGAPIYAEEAVLEKAGIILEEETGKSVPEGKVDEQELKGLSAYKDFINTLDLEDFKRRQS
ncbi:MAG TPA: bifunctional nuclease family protein [Chloroflexi bacterium]|nr:bifunctional nuclease family protein [Chloroflexota bacterium]